MNFRIAMAIALIAVVGIGLVFTFETPRVGTSQQGYRGLGMVSLTHDNDAARLEAANRVPEPAPPQDPSGKRSGEVYANVTVLQDLDSDAFLRLMAAITEWVSPEQGCAYCHADGDELSSDRLYTKVVSRRMLQMTLDINAKWKDHVAATGVTCYTCHRGNPVPLNTWFNDPGPPHARGMSASRDGQNVPSAKVGFSSLPFDNYSRFLAKGDEIKVVSNTALPAAGGSTIKQTEWTYGLMMGMSEGLGVNCTFCHNTRSFADWDQSSPQRVSAWHGIRMARALNSEYIEPLAPQLPEAHRGPLGDALKVNCATCHQGAAKPLLGANMLKDYPELGGPR